MTGLQKFAGTRVRQRGSSPKLLALNTGLVSALSGRTLSDTREQRDLWGRLVETAVGAHLLNSTTSALTEVSYWRERDQEVDFVVRSGSALIAVEVKTGMDRTHSGLETFRRTFSPDRSLLVGPGGIPFEEFFSRPTDHWLR